MNYAEAVKWFEKAADKGHSDVMCYLGWMYEYGHGVAKDLDSAVIYYQEAALMDNAFAQYTVGKMYADGYGVTADLGTARMCLEKAFSNGWLSAKEELSKLTPEYFKRSNAESLSDVGRQVSGQSAYALSPLARKGNVKAQIDLAERYVKGIGVVHDLGEFVRWHYEAAKSGNAQAQLELGNYYLKEYYLPYGAKENAEKWLSLAAKNGNETAKQLLTVMQ